MKDYFTALLTASVLGGVLCVFASGGAYEKYIKYIAGLICVVIIISPFKSLVSSQINPADIIGYGEPDPAVPAAVPGLTARLTAEEFDLYIKNILFNEFGIKPLYTDIKIDWNDEYMTVGEIKICLDPADGALSREVEDFILRTVGKAEIIIGE